MRTTQTSSGRASEVAAMVTRGRLTYTVEEVAVLLGVSRGAAYSAVRGGEVPAERIGRRWVVPCARFHAWLGEPLRYSTTTR